MRNGRWTNPLNSSGLVLGSEECHKVHMHIWSSADIHEVPASSKQAGALRRALQCLQCCSSHLETLQAGIVTALHPVESLISARSESREGAKCWRITTHQHLLLHTGTEMGNELLRATQPGSHPRSFYGCLENICFPQGQYGTEGSRWAAWDNFLELSPKYIGLVSLLGS